jgi:dTDP-4-dehydrorhamnose reductase
VFGLGHADLPVDERARVLEAVDDLAPDVVVHAAAYTQVDRAESEPVRAFAVNALGTRNVAEACARRGAHLVYVSTDYVFSGRSAAPYVEWDRPDPASVYGRSKLGGELECPPGATVVRTSWVCGHHGANMAKTVLRLAGGDGPLRFVDDQHGCPTFTADLAPAIVTLAQEGRPGVFHVTNQSPTNWYGFARAVLAAAGADPGRVEPIATAELDPPRPAPRPANSVLENAALAAAGLPLLPDWHDALERLVGSLGAGTPAGVSGGADR